MQVTTFFLNFLFKLSKIEIGITGDYFMGITNIKSKNFKIGFSNIQKKNGINFWRFFFTGTNKISKEDCTFYLEFEMINPNISPSQPISNLKQKEIIAEDFQSALLGNCSDLTETYEKSSYCVLRIAKLGRNPKQLCQYFPINDIDFNFKPFEIKIGDKLLSENKLTGFLNISKNDLLKNPEFLSNSGYATWYLEYKITKSLTKGFRNDIQRWFPLGIKSEFTGKINFDGEDFIVSPQNSNGYIERFFGSTFPKSWFHIHSSDLISLISGKKLKNSNFCIQGVFENKVSFAGNLEDIETAFYANKSKHSYNCVFDCTQFPGSENSSEQLLHWSFSINNKNRIIDIEIFCRLNELLNRFLESSEGKKKGLNLLEGGSGYGELKLYKQDGKAIEQIEHAKLKEVVCEFGETDTFGE